MNASRLEQQIKRVQAGDVEAFAEVISLWERPLRAWVVSRCPPGGDADDVAQKTFINAFKRIDQYTPGTDFGAWLFAIARYQLMAECTRLQRRADYHSRYAPHALSQELARRVEQSAAGESSRLALLRECLAEVKGQARDILRWRYTDELPLAEIAARTERSTGAIKKQLHLLRQKLHDCVRRKLAGETNG